MRTDRNRGNGIGLLRMAAGLVGCVGLVFGLTGCGSGGGGGGGGSSSTETVTGYVYDAVTGAAPTSTATLTIGTKSTMTAGDGSFSFTAPTGSQTVKITATGYTGRTYTSTIPTSSSNSAVNLGTLWISSSAGVATVTGTVELSSTLAGVGGATVTFAGVSAKTVSTASATAAVGSFTITNLPVGLGDAAGAAIGSISATNYASTTITSETLQFPLAAGSNNVGALLISPSVSTSTPGQPYTITGIVEVGSTPTSGITVTLTGGALTASSSITTTTDSAGTYYFWVPASTGAYTVTATYTPPGGSATTLQKSATVAALNAPVTVATMNFAN